MAITSNESGSSSSSFNSDSKQSQSIGDDFNSILADFGDMVAAGSGGEYYTKFRDSMVAIGKELLSKKVNLCVVGLSRQEHEGLRYSALTLILTRRESDAHVAHHTLLLEATGEELKPEVRMIDGQQVRVNIVTSDFNDKILSDLILNSVSVAYPSSTLYDTGVMVVPSSVQVTDTDSITQCVREAAMACASCLQSIVPNRKRLSLSTIGRDTRLILDMVSGDNDVYDVVGNPIRASVMISTMTQKKSSSSYDPTLMNGAGDTTKVCELYGFVNPLWAAQETQRIGFDRRDYRDDRPIGKLAAEFVITGIRSPFATSPAAVAMALSSVLLVTDNNNWVQALIPRGTKNEATDIGGLNVICNTQNETELFGYGSVVETDSMREDLGRFNDYVTALFQPTCMVSIDCGECTPNSWYTNLYAAAAMGDPKAIAKVIAAFDELTDDRFSEAFPDNAPLFVNFTRVPLGYYMGANKRKRDIRNVDLTVLCNTFKSAPENIHQWNETWATPRTNTNLQFIQQSNLSRREGIISHVLREQCKITGYAYRCMFSKATLEAMSIAIGGMKIATTINTPLSLDEMRYGTAAPDYISAGAVGSTSTYFNNAGMNRQSRQFTSMHEHQFGRRGR